MAGVFRHPHFTGPRTKRIVFGVVAPIVLAGGVATADAEAVPGTVDLPVIGAPIASFEAKRRVVFSANRAEHRPTWTRIQRQKQKPFTPTQAATPAPGTRVQTATFDVRTTVGEQDYTIPGFGVVKAYIAVTTLGAVDGTEVPDFSMSIGFTDGTRSRSVSMFADDGEPTESDTWHEANNSSIVRTVRSEGAVESRAAHRTFIRDGVRIGWTNAANPVRKIQITFFGGDSLEVFVDERTHSTAVDTTLQITDCGFDPQVVIFAGTADAFGQVRTEGGILNFGAAHDAPGGTTQGLITTYADDASTSNEGSTGNYNNRVLQAYTNADTPLNHLEVTDWVSGGFEITKRLDGTTHPFMFLALRSTTSKFFVGNVSIGSGTGNKARTGIGFKPQAVIISQSLVTGANVLDTAGVQASVQGMHFFDATREASFSGFNADGAGTSSASNFYDSTALELRRSNAAAGIVASFVSMDPDGFTLNYTVLNNADSRQLIFAVEQEGAELGIPAFLKRRALELRAADAVFQPLPYRAPVPKFVPSAPSLLPIVLTGGIATGDFEAQPGTVILPTVETSYADFQKKRQIALSAAREVHRPTWKRDPRRPITPTRLPNIVLSGGIATGDFEAQPGTVILPTAESPYAAFDARRKADLSATRAEHRPTWVRDPRKIPIVNVPAPPVVPGGIATADFEAVAGTPIVQTILTGGVATGDFEAQPGTVILPTVGVAEPAHLAKLRVIRSATREVHGPIPFRPPREIMVATVPAPPVVPGGIATGDFEAVPGTVILPTVESPYAAFEKLRQVALTSTRDEHRPTWTRDPRRQAPLGAPPQIVLSGGIATADFEAQPGTVDVPTILSGGIATGDFEAQPGTVDVPTILSGGIATGDFESVGGTVDLPTVQSNVWAFLKRQQTALSARLEAHRPTWLRDPRKTRIETITPLPIVLSGGIATADFEAVAGVIPPTGGGVDNFGVRVAPAVTSLGTTAAPAVTSLGVTAS